MWIFEHEVTTTATREQVWALWSDLASWPSWDVTLDSVKPRGEFASQQFAELKPKGAKVLVLELLDVDEPNGFVDIQLLPKAKMRTEHKLRDAEGGGLIVSQSVTFDGPLARVFRFVIGRGIKRDMPVAMRRLVERAEAS
jgi:uncharacterized membrane protein